MSDEINREDVRPELSQLCNELADLDSGDIKGLVVQLCDRRFTGADSVHWKELLPKSMQFWLDTDTTASWSKLVIALTSPSLNKVTIAENIRKKYCPWLSTVGSGGHNTLGNTRGTTISGDEERRLYQPRDTLFNTSVPAASNIVDPMHSATNSTITSGRTGEIDIDKDILQVKEILRSLEKQDLKNLFRELGLYDLTVRNKDSESLEVYAEDLVRAWILGKDNVVNSYQGGATWENLKKALVKINYVGVARSI